MKSASRPSLLTRGDGFRLAIELLRELEGASCASRLAGDVEIDDHPDIVAPETLLMRNLRALHGADAAEAMAGFLLVVSDFMAAAVDGQVLDGDHYERLLADEVA